MGSTRDAIEAGNNPVLAYCLTIEGYPTVITSWSDTAAVVTAYSGTGYTAAIRGLMPPTEYVQSIVPFRPRIESGSMQFHVVPDETDQFGQDVSAQNPVGAVWTRLAVDAEPGDATIQVTDVSGFASSGAAYIGTERFAYTGTNTAATPDQFTTCTRGTPTPFAIEGGTTFGRAHRVSVVAGAPVNHPQVTSFKRVWHGSLIACRVHRVVDGVLDTKAESSLVFAGTIAGISSGLVTSLSCTDARRMVTDAMLLADQYSCYVQDGFDLTTDDYITLTTIHSPTTPLVTEWTETAGGSYLGTGVQTYREIQNSIRKFIAANNTSAINWELREQSFRVQDSTASITYGEISVQMSFPIAAALGLDLEAAGNDSPRSVAYNSRRNLVVSGVATSEIAFPFGAGRSWGFPPHDATWTIDQASGEFLSQGDSIPQPWRSDYRTTAGTWGLLKWRDRLVFAKQTSSTTFSVKVNRHLLRAFGIKWDDDWTRFTFSGPVATEPILIPKNSAVIRADDDSDKIVQVVLMRGDLEDLLTRILASTGSTTLYNETTTGYDTLPLGLAAAIPWDLLSPFVRDLTAIADATEAKDLTVFLQKPTKLAELLLSEFALRDAHLIMTDEGLGLASSSSPTADTATYALTDSNSTAKPGEAVEIPIPHRAIEDVISHVKISYDYDLAGTPHSVLEIDNAQARTDYGGSSPLTIEAKNSYSFKLFRTQGQLEDLIGELGGNVLAYWGEPALRVPRSIAPTLFFMNPGDHVTLTSSHLRDPETGAIGTTLLPGWVTRVRRDWSRMSGECEIAILGPGPTTRSYSPSGYVDATANTDGFTAGYDSMNKILRLTAHTFSLSSEPVDASHFEVGDKVTVIVRSPSTPSSISLKWTDTVAGVSGNDVTLTTGLAGFDTGEEYWIFSQAYASAVPAQQADAYQAADNGSIASTVRARMWGRQQIPGQVLTLPLTTGRHEYPIDDGTWDSDGSPCTPAIHLAAAPGLVSMIHRRTAAQRPWWFKTAYSSSAGSNGTYYLVTFPQPVGVGRGDWSRTGLARYFSVGPAMATSAGTMTLRVTSSAFPPNTDATIAVSTLSQVEFFGPTDQITFTTTSSTLDNVTAQDLEVIRPPGKPYTWITVEMQRSTAGTNTFYGFHKFALSETK